MRPELTTFAFMSLMVAMLFCVITCWDLSAQKYHNQWLFGYDTYSGNPLFGLSVLDFNNDVVTVDYWAACGHDLGGGKQLCL